MPFLKNTKPLRSPWAYLSIQYKLSLSLAIALAAIVFIFYTISAQSNAIVTAAYEQSSAYYNINSLQQDLLEADALMQTYLSNVSSRSSYQEEWETLSTVIYRELNALNTDTSEITLEQYFLATALQTGFSPYLAACNTLMDMGLSDADTLALYAQYDITASIVEHLNSTALLLQTEALSEGQKNLSALKTASSNLQDSFFLFAIFIIFLFIFIICELIQDIVSPVLRFAETSAAIRDGNLDAPDVEIRTRDELYTLAVTFNEMKRNMKNLFDAMQRQGEMEQVLHQKEIESRETSALLAEAQMQQLRNQINPHFLFNTLNIISRTARYEKAKKSEKLILALARLFRYGLKTDADEVSLQREMNIVEDYISIQSTRFEGRVSLDWRISAALDPSAILVPTFLLQPLIENAVIHGLEPKLEGGLIRVRAHQTGNDLQIVLLDSGVGMTQETLSHLLEQQSSKGHVSGIGVGNVHSRLHLLHPDARFKVQSKLNKGTRISITIPNAFAQDETTERYQDA